MRFWRRRAKSAQDAARRVSVSSCGVLEPHDECAHVRGGIGAPPGEYLVCPCACHTPCPLAGTASVDDEAWRRACTCPGAEAIRRNQELIARFAPARIAQLMEASRQDWRGDEATRKERLKGLLAQAYEAAAAQVAGLPMPSNIHVDNPQQAMLFIVDKLARMDSGAEAARLLGLTGTEIAEARDAALENRLSQMRPHLERDLGQRRAERVIRHMRQAEGGR